MPRNALTGTRIRERRMLRGLRQAELARAVGVSPSYLNLIEHNRRRVGEPLLARFAQALGVEPAALVEGAEAALIGGLRAAAAEAAAPGGPVPELDRVEEFVGRFPGWAATLAATQARVAALERTVERLSDRIAHDPHLSTALHELLSAAAAVRSTAAILAETEDIDPAWRARFHRNLHADSERLGEEAQALVRYLDASAAEETRLATPQEEFEAWLAAQGYHVAALERSAPPPPEALVRGVPELASPASRALALEYLQRYVRDLRALPPGPFGAAVEAVGPDPGQLALRFPAAGLPAIFRRLASLPGSGRPGERRGRQIGLVACDGAGALTFRKPVDGFPLPRFGAGCALWPLYQALARPMAPLRCVVEMAGRLPQRFLTYAVCQPVRPAGFDLPQVVEALMLIVPDDGAAAPALPVGPTCRICPRPACPARRDPSLLAEGG
jgi:predicted transcriptional regulator/DNA-binding XRE family transcriptional regulator